MKKPKLITEILLFMLSLVFIIPAWMVLTNSFKEKKDANLFGIGLPAPFRFENYLTVFAEGNVLRALFNGLVVSLSAVALVVLLSSISAFVLARRKSKITGAAYYFFVSGMIIPLAFVPTYMIMFVTKLNNTYPGLILIFTTLCLPISVFLYTGFIRSVPRELDEAAIMDGCSGLRMFFSVIFPLLKPVTLTVVVFNFMGVWNDVQVQLFFASGDKWSMPMTVYQFYGQYIKEWNLIFADVVIAIIPMLLLYIVGQKYMIEGMTAGAVKG